MCVSVVFVLHERHMPGAIVASEMFRPELLNLNQRVWRFLCRIYRLSAVLDGDPVGGLGRGPDSALTKSARKPCISSSGHVLNLHDPARD